MKRLHATGLGVATKQAEPISPDEEAILWANGLFGTYNAKVFTNTVYFYNCKIFSLRSFDEHRKLCRDQFSKKIDQKGRVYLQYTDFGNKTNRGGLKHMKVEPKIVQQYEDENDPDHCVVNIFVKYICFTYPRMLITFIAVLFLMTTLVYHVIVSRPWDETSSRKSLHKCAKKLVYKDGKQDIQ